MKGEQISKTQAVLAENRELIEAGAKSSAEVAELRRKLSTPPGAELWEAMKQVEDRAPASPEFAAAVSMKPTGLPSRPAPASPLLTNPRIRWSDPPNSAVDRGRQGREVAMLEEMKALRKRAEAAEALSRKLYLAALASPVVAVLGIVVSIAVR